VILMPKKLSYDEVCKRILDKHNGQISLIGNFVNVKSKATMRCNVCSLVWETEPYSIYIGHNCPRCTKKLKLTTEIFKEQIRDLVGDEYTVLGKYKTIHTKIKFKHN